MGWWVKENTNKDRATIAVGIIVLMRRGKKLTSKGLRVGKKAQKEKNEFKTKRGKQGSGRKRGNELRETIEEGTIEMQ